MSPTPDALILWLPMPPDNANGRLHPLTANREKRAYCRELDTRAQAKRIPPPPAVPLPRATVAPVVHYPNRRHLIDSDNMVRRLKPAIDWLVLHGYLAGDDPARLAWAPVAHVVGAPTPLLSRVRLTLTPAPTP